MPFKIMQFSAEKACKWCVGIWFACWVSVLVWVLIFGPHSRIHVCTFLWLAAHKQIQGGPVGRPLAPKIYFQNHAVFRQFKGKTPYFEQVLGLGPPWGQNSTGPPWPKSWIRRCGLLCPWEKKEWNFRSELSFSLAFDQSLKAASLILWCELIMAKKKKNPFSKRRHFPWPLLLRMRCKVPSGRTKNSEIHVVLVRHDAVVFHKQA